VSEDDADDDWFESALDDEDADTDWDVDQQTADGEAGDWARETDEAKNADDGDGGAGDWTDEVDADGADFDAGDAFSGDGTDADESGTGDPTAGDTGPDSGSAFGETDDDGGAFGEADDGDSPFGDSADSGGAFGDEDGDSPFEEDFGSAFQGGGDDEFDEENFESDIPRIDLGIEGLDTMIQGGVPQRHLMVVIGSAGTGKTTFGLQFLYHGLQNGENTVFITLEQSHEAIIDTANEWGWNFDEFEAEDRLAVVDLDPVEMANSLDNIRGELPELIREFNADRLVLDSVSLLEMMYNDPARRRTEVFDFTRSLKEAGVTTFLTSEASESNPYASRHGIIEYLTDAVFILQYVRGETTETRLAVEIQKIRNANHSREKKPYEITSDGLSVYQQANIF
jgi:KaiC domain protein